MGTITVKTLTEAYQSLGTGNITTSHKSDGVVRYIESAGTPADDDAAYLSRQGTHAGINYQGTGQVWARISGGPSIDISVWPT